MSPTRDEAQHCRGGKLSPIAAALSFVLFTFGTAIGLSATSPWPNSGVSAKALASLAVFWALAQQIGAFMVGGYVAGADASKASVSS
jgi:hypothetical protein